MTHLLHRVRSFDAETLWEVPFGQGGRRALLQWNRRKLVHSNNGEISYKRWVLRRLLLLQRRDWSSCWRAQGELFRNWFQGSRMKMKIFQVETFVCFNNNEAKSIKLKFQIYAVLLAISAVFFAITFLVYIFLPKLLNLHGKTLVCHVLSMFVGYSFLSAVQLTTDVRMTYCKCIGEIGSTEVDWISGLTNWKLNLVWLIFSLHRVLQLLIRYLSKSSFPFIGWWAGTFNFIQLGLRLQNLLTQKDQKGLFFLMPQ